MKICCRCKIEKSVDQFSKDKSAKDGLDFKCKLCQSIRRKEYAQKYPERIKNSRLKNIEKNYDSIRLSQRKHFEKNREKINERKRKNRLLHREEFKEKENARRRTPEFREYARNYQREFRSNKKELIYAWRLVCTERHKIKILANQQLCKAIKRGKIIRPTQCEKCKVECKPDGHHIDYSKPLEVQWLCKICHNQAHGKLMDIKI